MPAASSSSKGSSLQPLCRRHLAGRLVTLLLLLLLAKHLLLRLLLQQHWLLLIVLLLLLLTVVLLLGVSLLRLRAVLLAVWLVPAARRCCCHAVSALQHFSHQSLCGEVDSCQRGRHAISLAQWYEKQQDARHSG
jgi:hypothetical protein